MDKDLEYIKDIFDSDGITAPEKLSEENIMAMLSDPGEFSEDSESVIANASCGNEKHYVNVQENERIGVNAGVQENERIGVTATAQENARTDSRRRIIVRRIAALAACAVIALAGVPQIYNAVTAAPDVSLVDGELYTFSSYGEIRRLVKSMDNSGVGFSFFRMGSSGNGDVLDYESDGASEEAFEVQSNMDTGVPVQKSAAGASFDASADPSGSAGPDDHSSTYLQVEAVDEADVIKTDGKYIYYVTDNAEVIILEAKDGKTSKVATIGSSGNNGTENYISDIFLKGDTLVTVGRVYDEDDGYAAAVIYDITDRANPQMTGEFRQTGTIVSSRMVGDYVYLVTTDYVYSDGRFVPMCTIDGTYKELPYEDISCVPDPASSSYTVLSAVDITSGKTARAKTRAVFGSTDEIYCNDHNLYAAVTEWDSNKGEYSTYTRIVRASLDGLKIKFNATSRVRGYTNDQFSMNEKDGYFYIATTGQRDGMDVNNLFVLDGKLKEAGKVAGFARNESIRAVRYIGNKAYVITYEQIDPLFIIDLTDPSDPHIEGEVEIDGFSSLLIPVADGRLLGIGHATGDNGYGGEYASGLKLALFDTSDPSGPKVLSSREFKDMESPAQSSHLALSVNKKDGWYAIPYSIYNYLDDDVDVIEEDSESGDADVIAEDNEQGDTDDETAVAISDAAAETGAPEYDAGVLVFSADDEINVIDQHHLATEYLPRSVYIGNYIYALDGSGNAYSFSTADVQ